MHTVNWILENKEWLFSGIVATIFLATGGWLKSQRQNRPLAVGYDIFGPHSYPIPVDILKEDNASETHNGAELVILVLQIDNHSDASCRNVRILYSAKCKFPARVEFKRRDTEVKYDIDHKSKEIIISEIPPNETVSVAFFNPYNGFSINHVMIGDAAITDSMRKHVQAKRYPMLYWSERIATAALFIAAAVIFWAGYVLWKNNRDNQLILSATDNLRGCLPTVIHDANKNPDDLIQRFSALSYPFNRMVLAMNKATSLQELTKKRTVVFCESNQE